ncbi:BTB/POZ and MATH domain-containing protein 2-like [Brachypodium distachyon]|uniref:BTB/POZ and MATH domain-containing protein 2-like n=1 Tax=Brachypodium distachyon TaxID=15368 RepID=UPI000234F4CD|nr:BTB/POZ and MATH domain-containing protein 2-like [Brachypodium distachyon]|eukprot:XP_024318703.1 BTB/POZ and MATH domain-containing protein 2-like [Brachypodium distachyon]
MSVPCPSSVDMSASAIVAKAVSGSHILKIDGYSRTKGLGNGKFIKSEKFAIGGHRWRMLYYPDGDVVSEKAADWISIYLAFDRANANEVKAQFGFSLLDQDMQPVPSYSRKSKKTRTFSSKDTAWGFRKFIRRKELEESSYLKDDVFSVRCDVTLTTEIVTQSQPAVQVPPSDMAQHLGQLLSASDGADVTFHVGGESFPAHRYMLAARSSVFKAELLGAMKEKTAAHVRIDGVEAKVFKALLHFIYTDSLPAETDDDGGDTAAMAQHLLEAADRYNIERLKLICGDKLCNLINRSTVATTLALAEQHGCGALKNACFKFLTSPGNLKAVMASEDYEHLKRSCPSLLEELVAKLAL